MYSSKPFEPSDKFSDTVAQSADQTKKSTVSAAGEALGSLTGTVQDIRQQAGPMLDRAAEQASALAQRGLDTVRETSQQLRDKALRASENTVKYVKDEPVKSVLIAVATGAALMALASMKGRSRERGERRQSQPQGH